MENERLKLWLAKPRGEQKWEMLVCHYETQEARRMAEEESEDDNHYDVQIISDAALNILNPAVLMKRDLDNWRDLEEESGEV